MSLGNPLWTVFVGIYILFSVPVLFKVNIDPDFEALKSQHSTEEPEIET